MTTVMVPLTPVFYAKAIALKTITAFKMGFGGEPVPMMAVLGGPMAL